MGGTGISIMAEWNGVALKSEILALIEQRLCPIRAVGTLPLATKEEKGVPPRSGPTDQHLQARS